MRFSTSNVAEESPKFDDILNIIIKQIHRRETIIPQEVTLKISVNNKFKCLSLYTSGILRIFFNPSEDVLPLVRKRDTQINNVFVTHSKWENLSGLLAVHPVAETVTKENEIVQSSFSFCSISDIDKLWPHLEKSKYLQGKFSRPISGKEILTNAVKVKPIIFHSGNTDANRKSTDSSVAYLCTLLNAEEITSGKSDAVNSVLTGDHESTNSEMFMVLDVPSADYLDSLLEQKEFDKHIKTNESIYQPSLIIHLSPSAVMQNEKYHRFVSRFSDAIKHVVVNDAPTPLYHPSPKDHLHSLLNYLYPDIFLKLFDEDVIGEKSYNFPAETIQLNEDAWYIRNTKFINRNNDLSPLRSRFMRYLWKNKPANDVIKKCISERRVLLQSRTDMKPYPRVIFLGTSSARPSANRNVSAILVEVSPGVKAILDCGNGTWTQLKALYGVDRAREVLKEVKLLFISHHHTDHFCGSFTLLLERRKAFEESGIKQVPKLIVLSLDRALNALIEFDKHISPILDNNVQLIDSTKMNQGGKTNIKIEELFRQEMNISVQTTEVDHSIKACAIAIIHEDFKLVFSGDTRPCYNLVNIGKDCDILIHEASECDSMKHLANRNHHSTISEAIYAGQNMGAKEIYLTHFSTKYYPFPPLEKPLPDNVAIAFDFMNVGIGDISYLKGLIPALEAIYKERIQKRVKWINEKSFYSA